MKQASIKIVSISVLLAMMMCISDFVSVGTGEETTNGRLCGVVIDSNEHPVKGAIVTMVPLLFDPVKDSITKPITITDSKGQYKFNNVKSGVYNVLSQYHGQLLCAMAAGVTVNSAIVEISPLKLLSPGSVKVSLPEELDFSTGYIYIPGTGIFAHLNGKKDNIVLDSVPAGQIPSIVYAQPKVAAFTVIRYDVMVDPLKTVNICNPAWLHTQKIVLNTSETGADISATVVHFPVLIRLHNKNQLFCQSLSKGKDIRFARNDTTFLPYEIEQWDSANGQAIIWVNVDTIRGNDSTQFLTMYWGNAKASSMSISQFVFDTSYGFTGVWHMNESPVTGAACIMDRTILAHHATPFGSMMAENLFDGVVGKSLDFDGVDDFLDAGDVPLSDHYSIGLWLHISDTKDNSQRFIHKDSSVTLWYDKDLSSVRIEQMSDSTWWRGMLQDSGSVVPANDGVWQYVTGTFDGSLIRLYKNGELMSVTKPIQDKLSIHSNPVFFGKSKTKDFVKGSMDEIRIEKVARTQEWIRLCFINQGPDDRLLKFK
jgi:hypothetical protein